MNSYFSYAIVSEFLLCVNSYILPNSSIAEAADIDLVAAAVDNSLSYADYTPYSTRVFLVHSTKVSCYRFDKARPLSQV